MEPPKPLPAESLPMLREGINLTLSRWSALQMAVENEWGGPYSRDKANKLCDDIFNWFTQSTEPLYIDDLEEDLLEKGLDSLNTDAEDGSIQEVSEKLMILHEECTEGNYSSIMKLREVSANRTVHSHVKQVVNEDDDDSDTDEDGMGEADMMVDASPPIAAPTNRLVDEPGPAKAPEAEDGWTVVGSRSRKRNCKNK